MTLREVLERTITDEMIDCPAGTPDPQAARATTRCLAALAAAGYAVERAGEVQRLLDACSAQNAEVCDTLGRALGYPRLADDQANFPGATDDDGVCVGDHVAESIAAEAAALIEKYRREGHAPPGYAVVPVEPTEAMLRATNRIDPCINEYGQCYSEEEIYRAMLAAAAEGEPK